MYLFAFTLCYLGVILIPTGIIALAIVNHLMKGADYDNEKRESAV